MGVSDRIETFITELLKDEDGWIEIGRNELASIFNCVPSQINYVISTRFSPGRGYLVESKRGGGGCLKIKRIISDSQISDIISLVKDEISLSDAKALLDYLLSKDKLTEREYKLSTSALSDKSLAEAEHGKEKIRADILKNILLSLI